MADFQTFNLGQVLQTAEAIKAARSQSTVDRLREQYLGEQIQGMRSDRERQTKLDQMTFGKERAAAEHRRAGYIIESANPKNLIESVPEFQDIQKMVVSSGQDWATVTDDQLKEAARQIQAKAGSEAGIAVEKPKPYSTQGRLVADQRSGFLTPEQVASANAPKPPQSYEEHILAQKDPEFAAFLKARKGKGLSVTLPDGTVVEMGGEGGSVGPGDLSKPTVNNLQETIVNSSNRLDRLNLLLSSYKPDYLRAKGVLKAGAAEAKDFLGMDVSQQDKEFLRGRSEFQASASQEFSATLKELSGTAASESEVARVIKGVPSDQDKSPEVFEAKARATTKFITRAIMRANWALKNGIGVQSVNELSRRMPLEGIDGVYEGRANEIWQQMGGTPETKAQAITEANKEFGLAR